MATQRAQKRLSSLRKSRKFRDLARQESRRLNLEQLEDRRVMATGPALAALIPNGGVFLNNNDTLKVAPRELLFRFAEGQVIDGASILNGAGEADNGIRIMRSVNGIWGDADDAVVTPGFMGLVDSPREVIMRFAENLPDDLYRVTIIGAGTTPLKDSIGNAANGGVDLTINFNLDLGAKVQAIVPQPITRNPSTGALTQNLRAIEVYFDHNELGTSVTNSAFYRLINTATGPNGSITLPQSVAYDPAQRKATLTFANDIPVGTFRLDVGTTDEPNETTSQAVHLGNSMASVYQAFLGDNTTLPAAQQSRDVDLYRFELRSNTAITVNLTPSAALDGVVRIFDSAGAQIGVVVNGGGAGAAEVVTTGSLTAGTYYVGITSAGNAAYNPNTGAGAVDGNSTGAYSFRVTFSDLPALSDANSSYATATPLGVLGLAGRVLAASIAPQSYNIPFPGAGDDPGHRDVPYENHLGGGGGGTAVIPYNFQDIYGFSPQGNPFFNAITENQKQRAREVFELYGRYLGVQFFETPSSGFIIATGDPRALDPTIPPLAVGGIAGGNVAVMNAAINWGNSEYGSGWFTTAMHEIGHLLGLGHAYDLPNLTIQGGAETPGLSANPAEPVFPGDHDILHGQTLFRPQSRDIDLYQFTVTEAGVLRAETIAERLGVASNQLNTVLTLYKETTTGGLKREIISRNDDYYSSDSYLELRLEPGVYYVAVTASGNTEIDPNIPDSGFGGRSTGSYELKMEFTPAAGTSLADTTGVKFDGDADGREGGVYSFWFQSGNTIFVDKARDITPAVDGLGTLASPYDTLSAALAAADAFAQASPGVPSLVRIVGNGGTDGNPLTLADNKAYLIGFKDQDAILDEPLADGADFMVPKNVTVMIDAGANFKLRKANMDAGSSAQGVDRSGGAIQVLGTPFVPVRYTSYHDDSIGGNSDGPLPGAVAGDWGGIVYRNDSDRESAVVYLNYVNNAFLQYGGGRVFVDSIESAYTPVHLVSARPAITYNTITQSADAALSGDPNSFDDDGYSPNIAFKDRRIGPDIHDNTLTVATPTGVLSNTVNGLFVRIRSLAGNPIDRLDVTARFDDTDIVHVIAENLLISGTPGGSISPGADRDPTLQFDARLQIDPGMIVKLSGARIEAKIGSQFIAEGSLEQPIIFTSLKDDKYGGSGTFDTNRDGSASSPAAGQWGGLVFGANSSASLDFTQIYYGGGTIPIEGGFDRFNPIEINQADVRIANSVLQFNSDGGSATNRNGRGFSFSSTIMVTGAQPVVVNNNVRDNAGPVISINANAMQDTVLADLGRTTGPVADFNPANDNLASENRGPFVRGNRMISNAINGMEVRGAVLTTETVWDDTDIAHILRGEIVVLNQHVYNGLRLQSRPNESLVVKLAGAAAGFTAGGVPLDIDDRIGGTVHIVGQPGRPVVLTDLADDTVPAGFQPDGLPLFDTNSNGPSTGTAGAWRSIRLDKHSNDFNASIQLERENAQVGNGDANRTPQTAQVLGSLAPNEKAGDDIRRLAYEIDGTIAYDRPNDVDVYSFTADSGTEVWIDLDRTSFGLDAMVELVDANGNVIARATDTDPLGRTPPLDTPPNTVGLSGSALTYNKDPYLGRDFYTTNPHDAIMRVILPGFNLKNIPYFVRVRSQPASLTTPAESGNTLNPGLTSGHYQLQVRLRQPDVKPGSTVRFADIRFATNAVEVLGLPSHSPLTSESEEANDGANNAQGGAQQLGNLVTADKNTLSVGGFIGSVGDVDFYQFDLNVDLIQVIGGSSDGGKTWATIFDIDYADGITRADTTISVFDRDGRLILVSRDGDIEDDQPAAGQGADTDDLSRGSFGKLDPYIGSVQLPAGLVGTAASRTYYVAVSTNRRLPSALDQTFNSSATAPLTRMEPIDSLYRMAADHLDASGGETASLPESQLIDFTNLQTVSAHVRSFSLEDVSLFVSTQTRVFNVDPARGVTEVDIGAARTSGQHAIADIGMRADGILFGYEEFVPGANTAGRLTTIDTGNGAATAVSNDNIPDIPNPPPNPLDPQQVNTASVGALAWGGTPINGVGNNTLFYAVDDPAAGASRLYRADPANGSAAVVQGQPWGRAGGLTSFITLGNQANGQTNFALGTPTLDIRAIAVGPAGNGTTINFTHANLGAGQPPRLNPATVPGPPAIINVELNLASATAQAQTNFNTGGAVTMLFQANQSGAAGNNITLTFTKSDLGPGAGPAINVVGTVIQVTLNTNAANPTTAGGLITAIQNNFQANALITPTITTGNANTIISTPSINYSPLTLSGGADPTTAQQVANLLNTTGIVTAQVTAGNPFAPVSFGQAIPSVVLTTGSGGSGFTTGLAFAEDGFLYGVTDRGLFQRRISTGNARPLQEVSVTLPGVGQPRFSGLARGPRNVENGAYSDLLFAITDSGQLCALNTDGIPQQIFDTNGDGTADSVVINTLAGATGLAFSPFDFNLWHPTFRREDDAGHDVGPSPTLNDGRTNDADNMSFYFGFEQRQQNPGPQTDSYLTYGAFENQVAHQGQLGIISDQTQNELSQNPLLPNTYNVPGGAYGSLITDSFNLSTIKRTDKPTFYFDYFLNTSDVNSGNNGNMRDSARVYVSPNGGTSWELIATNNSTLDDPTTTAIEGEIPTFLSTSSTEMPANARQQVQLLHDNTGTWRQARVDLSRYAGLDNVLVRFDFSTAGDQDEGLFEDSFGNFNNNGRGQNNQFEGFYIDNLIVGLAERGEMVINAPASNSNFFATPVPQDLNPLNPVPTEVLAGPYQLEIRRGTEYGATLQGTLPDIGLFNSFDSNNRLVEDTRLGLAIPFEGFESGNLNLLPWSVRDDAPWTVTNVTAATGTFSAGSGPIGNGESSGLELSLTTSTGNMSFAVSTSAEADDVLNFYIDGFLVQTFGGVSGFQNFSFPITAGRHHFRWSYDKGEFGSAGLDRVFIDNVTFPTPQRGTGTIGDQNLTRDQGQILIEQNSIFAPSQVGILVDAGGRDTPDGSRTYPGGVRNLPTLNNELLAPGTTLTNNVVANFGQVGIRFSGDANPVNSAEAATPFGRIVNNTVYGGATANGIGIEVIDNAGPTLLNNIVSNSVTGILVDGSSTATTVIGENLYSGNTANGPLGTEPIVLPPGTPLFVDPANRNFYLVSGSPAIDSSINTLVDRESIKAVKSIVGIPESPILAPDRDVFGQLRVDDPSQDPPPGLGANIFKDRGAVERADFGGPTTQLIDPFDNDGANRDRDPDLTEVIIRNETLTRFVVKLLDLGTGIDDLTVDASKFTLTKDGVAMVLGTDYTFVFNSNSDEVTFLPVSGQWENNKTYVILLDNSATTGIRDLAANPVQPNQTDGTTKFTIFVGTVRDFGDAPSPYPSLQANNGAAHDVTIGYHLGANVTEEQDAKLTPPGDEFDDGITSLLLSPGNASSFNVTASGAGFIDAWIDLNKDGDWDDADEYVVSGGAVAAGTTTVNFTFGTSTTPFGQTWARFRFSSTGINTPTGVALDGEVEDYQVTLTGPPFQNPILAPDVDNDGGVDTIDLLIVINFLTFLQTQLLPGSPPGTPLSLPPTSPPYVNPPPVFDPTGGGVPGDGRYVDVAEPFGLLTPVDLLAIVNYLTVNFTPGGGEGEGEGFAAATAAAGTTAGGSSGSTLSVSEDSHGQAAGLLIPETLYASPNIVLDVRDTFSASSLDDNSWLLSQGSDSLDLVAAATPFSAEAVSQFLSLDQHSRRKLPVGPLDSDAWENLLADLSLDVGGLPGDTNESA